MLENILVGNGLPSAINTRQVLESVREAGWEVIEYRDLAEPEKHFPIPWYEPLNGGLSIRNFRTTKVGIALTTAFCWVFETLRILPRGTYDTQQFLIRGAKGLVEGGKKNAFTPMFFFLARKPEDGARPKSSRTRAKSPRTKSKSPRKRR